MFSITCYKIKSENDSSPYTFHLSDTESNQSNKQQRQQQQQNAFKFNTNTTSNLVFKPKLDKFKPLTNSTCKYNYT